MPPKKAYESYESESEADSQCGKGGKTKRQKLDKNSDEYKKRRERNNVAVRKSREASRQKAKDTMQKVARLREENQALEQKVTILNKELGVLRDLFLTHATATASVQGTNSTKSSQKNEDTNCNTAESKNQLYYVDADDFNSELAKQEERDDESSENNYHSVDSSNEPFYFMNN